MINIDIKYFTNIMQKNKLMCFHVFTNAKRMVKLAVSDEDKKIAWKSHHENLLNTVFA